jgi:hypothetical protein
MGKGGRNKHPRKKTTPLPKVGTPANDAYRLRQSRKDLVDFGMNRPGERAARNKFVVAGGVVLVFLAIVVLIALTL